MTFKNKLSVCQKCFKIICNIKQKQKLMIPLCRNSSYLGKANVSYHSVPQRSSYLSTQTRFHTTSSENHSSNQTTVDEDELQKFTKLAAQWWDEKGELYALHSMNRLRIPMIRDALVRSSDTTKTLPLKDKYILDVGSGGGILTEPLARLGATLTGIDMVKENIQVAQTHLMEDTEIAGRIKYIHGAVEDLVATEEGKFDAVVSSEVVEHVSDIDVFLSSCCRLLKPGGSLFITTLNKTYLSYGLAILGAEYLLRVVPPGTHDWNKFVPPDDLQHYLEQNGMTVQLLHGICFNPVINRWSWISNTDVNYAIHAVKTDFVDSRNTIEQTEY